MTKLEAGSFYSSKISSWETRIVCGYATRIAPTPRDCLRTNRKFYETIKIKN